MPSQEYLQNQGLSFHKLKYFADNGAGKFRARFIDKEIEEEISKDALRLGRLWHTAILEPQLLKEQWTIIEAEHYTPKGILSKKKATTDYIAELGTEDFCSEKELDHIVDCANKIHERHEQFFDTVKSVEQERYDTFDGVPIKFCADMVGVGYDTGRSFIGDVKTISDLADRHRHIEDYGYLKQLAWYHHHMIGPPKAKEKEACILWVEKSTGQSMVTWIRPRRFEDAHTKIMCDFKNYKKWVDGTGSVYEEVY